MLLRLRERVLNRPLMISDAGLLDVLAALADRMEISVINAPPRPVKRLDRSSSLVYENGVAVVDIGGKLLLRRGGGIDAESGAMSYEDISREVIAAGLDDSVRKIVLRIDSPGGEAGDQAFRAAQDIREVAAIKPVIAVADSLAASAAYLLASQATELYLGPSARVGSIGVYWVHMDRSGELEIRGLKPTVVKAGARKDLLSDLQPLSKEGLAEMQRSVDAMMSRFVEAVIEGRPGLTEEAVRGFEAGVFEGEAAVEAGLADGVMDWRDALRAAISDSDAEPGGLAAGKRKQKGVASATPKAAAAGAGGDEEQRREAMEKDDKVAPAGSALDAADVRDAAVLRACRQHNIRKVEAFADAVERAQTAPADVEALAALYAVAGQPEEALSLLKRGMTSKDFATELLNSRAAAADERETTGGVLPHEGERGAQTRRSAAELMKLTFPGYEPPAAELLAIRGLAAQGVN